MPAANSMQRLVKCSKMQSLLHWILIVRDQLTSGGFKFRGFGENVLFFVLSCSFTPI